MEPNLSEYITEYWTTENESNIDYDEMWAEKEDMGWEDRCYDE